ncbi:MAG: hypothetical protein WBA31_10390 [Candidatus Dormiibacterota bacterium]
MLPLFWLLIVTVPPAVGLGAVEGDADGNAVPLGEGLEGEPELLAPNPVLAEVEVGDRTVAHPAAAKMRPPKASTRATLDPHVQGFRITPT